MIDSPPRNPARRNEAMNGAAKLYALSQIAAALAPFYSKRRVAGLLANTRPDGKKVVGGNLADAWLLNSLPKELIAELEARRRSHGCRTVEAWVDDPSRPWQPGTPLARADGKTIESAEKLQRALSRVLALPAETSIAERARLASDDFQRECGYLVNPRHLRRLITRTMERDAGLEAWNRLEIYLPDNPRAKHPSPLPPAGTFDFAQIADALASVEDRARPTASEVAYCWRMIVETIALQVQTGAAEKRVKRAVCGYVVKSAPFLANNIAAFRRNLNHKWKEANNSGVAALVDRRSDNSGHKRTAPDWEENILLFAKWTRTRGGRESQAWRELWTGTHPHGWQFTQAFRDYYPFAPRSAKSQVPNACRAAIRPMIEATNAIHLGPRAAKIAMPSIHRDWSDTAAGDFYTADDVTVNHYWFEEHEFGEYEFDGNRFNVGRGQWLICCDERTDFPLTFVLMPNRNYNSRVICTLNTRTFSDERIGLPFKGMKYERNIWEARNIASQFKWSEIDERFLRYGVALRVRHATTPKAKIIERVIGSAQNMMDHLPGYVGRDEKSVRYERVQKFLASLKRVGQPIKAEVDPREMLMSKDRFADELVKVMRAFADEPQNGERLAGLSPAEAWRQLSPGKAHVVLPDSLRYLLTSHKSEQTVTGEGIKLEIGNVDCYYCGHERLGELKDEKVEAYYNDEQPEQIVVVHRRSDPKGLDAFSVPLFERRPANTATAEHYARARQHQKAFTAYGKAVYRIIAPPTNLTLRDTQLGSPEARELGDKINAFEREQITINRARGRSAGAIKQLASRSGLAIDAAKVRNPERVIASLEKADELEERIRQMEAGETHE